MVKNAFIVKVIGILCDMEDIQAKEDSLQAKWEKEVSEAKGSKARSIIDTKYEKLLEKLGKKSDELYTKYYNLMHKRYGNIDVSEYKDYGSGFLDKRLVYKLENKRNKNK